MALAYHAIRKCGRAIATESNNELVMDGCWNAITSFREARVCSERLRGCHENKKPLDIYVQMPKGFTAVV